MGNVFTRQYGAVTSENGMVVLAYTAPAAIQSVLREGIFHNPDTADHLFHLWLNIPGNPQMYIFLRGVPAKTTLHQEFRTAMEVGDQIYFLSEGVSGQAVLTGYQLSD
jgi:hypothetical protein